MKTCRSHFYLSYLQMPYLNHRNCRTFVNITRHLFFPAVSIFILSKFYNFFLVMRHSRPLSSFSFRLLNSVVSKEMDYIWWWLDSNCGTLVSEAPALPTIPQPSHLFTTFLVFFVKKLPSYKITLVFRGRYIWNLIGCHLNWKCIAPKSETFYLIHKGQCLSVCVSVCSL